ncbi:ATP-dependent helicase, partial [Patescibacteria group bacterium]|nr:ATP-dependent helicase [Patescibacteria group bacterium]
PLLIVAGAGTGKTTAITRRIAYLIEQGLAKSDEILALTFTEKAAGEMEERVDRLLPMGYLDLWISTFHSFAERILKDHCLDIGLPGGFKLLNEFEQWALIRKNLDKFNLDYYRPLGNPTKFIHALIKHFSRLKDEDISPAQYLSYAEELRENLDGMMSGEKLKNRKANCHSDPAKAGEESRVNRKKLYLAHYGAKPQLTRDPSSLLAVAPQDDNRDVNKEIAEQEIMRINEVANAYHIYQQLLLDNNGLDFGDLINYCLKLFRERPAILEKYRKQFKYILLDEFQDTNWAQYELVKMLAAPRNNLAVLCDDDQSIYKFRGASVSNILQFKKDYPNSKQTVLVNNYRNKQNILDLSYEFIKLNNPNRLEWQLNKPAPLRGARPGKQGTRNTEPSNSAGKQVLNKKLVAQKKGEGVIEVIQGSDLQDEVRQVVEKIADIKIKSRLAATNGDYANEYKKEATWNDFAILVRANESAKEFCNALETAGLPYQFMASRGLYSKPVIMDVIAYLKMLDNYHESPALYRVLNLPVFDFSYQELVNFNYWARKKSWSLYEILKSAAGLNLGKEIQDKISKVLSLIGKHTVMVRDKTVSEVIMAFLNDSGYLKYLTKQDERKSGEAMNLLNQFMKRAKIFEAASDDKSVKGFLAEFDMEIESGEQGALAPDIESGPEAIKVMTVHAAKGLEFQYVFIANMVDKRFPTTERKEQIRIPDALIKEILPQGDIHLEEERRLFYVAITRAKQGLYFSWAPDYGGARKKKPSRFLAECGLMDRTDKTNQTNKTNKAVRPPLGRSDRSVKAQDKEKISIPNYFSYTQLAAFSNCPCQYRFAHILRVPVRGKAIFSFGKTMHATLQKVFELINEKRAMGQESLFEDGAIPPTPLAKGGNKTNIISLEEILKLYEESWIDDWYENKKQKEEYKKKGKEILKGFYEKHHRQGHRQSGAGGTGQTDWPRTIFLEKGFNFKLLAGEERYTIRGAIDRIDEINGKIKIIDYKTGRPKEKLSFEEKEQLLIYQLAIRDLFKQEISSLAFYYLDNNSEAEFLGAEEELSKVKEKILAIINEIKKGEFPARPSELCKFCDFKEICEFRKI